MNTDDIRVMVGAEEHTIDRVSFVPILVGIVKGSFARVRSTLDFFQGTRMNSIYWNPWGKLMPFTLRHLAPYVEDDDLRDLLVRLDDHIKILNKLCLESLQFLCQYYAVAFPPDQDAIYQLARQRTYKRKGKRGSWLELEPIKATHAELQKLNQDTSRLEPVLMSALRRVYYADYKVLFEGAGDQRAKDLLDQADSEASPSAQIKFLKRALKYGEKGLIAQQVFYSLALSYVELEKYQDASDNLTQALNAWDPAPMMYLRRAECAFKLEQYDSAREDVNKALSYPTEEWWAEDYSRAKQLQEQLSSLT